MLRYLVTAIYPDLVKKIKPDNGLMISGLRIDHMYFHNPSKVFVRLSLDILQHVVVLVSVDLLAPRPPSMKVRSNVHI